MSTCKLSTCEELRILEALRQQKIRYNKLYGEALIQRPPNVKVMQHCQKEWDKTHKLMIKFGYLDY